MPRHKRSSWGSNTEVARGVRRIRYWADLHDGRGYRRVSETVRGTRRQADETLALRRVEHSADSPTPTVTQAHDAWWVPWADTRVANGKMAPGTRAQFDGAWRRHVQPRWGDVAVGDVRPHDVQEWLLSMTNSQASVSKVVLSRVLDRARFAGATDNDPFSVRYEMPPRGPRARSAECWDADGLRRVWDAVRGGPAEEAFLPCAFGGCRVSEALGTRCAEVEDVGCDGVPGAAVPIVRQATKVPGEVTARLKTRDSRRWAVVPGPMGARLLEIARARVEGGHEWMCAVGEDNMTASNLTYAFRRALAAAGIPYLPPQTLRPSWQTIARYTLRMDPPLIERAMGHSVGGVTGAHYDRPSRDDYVGVVMDAYSEHPYADGWDI